MAVIEVTNHHIRYLFVNEEYRKTLQSIGIMSLEKNEEFVNDQVGPTSKNMQRMLANVINSHTEETLTYTLNGRYVKLEANYLASHGQHHLVQLYLTNITMQTERKLSENLDQVTRNLLSLYQMVFLVDMEKIQRFR